MHKGADIKKNSNKMKNVNIYKNRRYIKLDSIFIMQNMPDISNRNKIKNINNIKVGHILSLYLYHFMYLYFNHIKWKKINDIPVTKGSSL